MEFVAPFASHFSRTYRRLARRTRPFHASAGIADHPERAEPDHRTLEYRAAWREPSRSLEKLGIAALRPPAVSTTASTVRCTSPWLFKSRSRYSPTGRDSAATTVIAAL